MPPRIPLHILKLADTLRDAYGWSTQDIVSLQIASLHVSTRIFTAHCAKRKQKGSAVQHIVFLAACMGARRKTRHFKSTLGASDAQDQRLRNEMSAHQAERLHELLEARTDKVPLNGNAPSRTSICLSCVVWILLGC